MLTSTVPVAGLVIALFAAAASVSVTRLTTSLLYERYSAVHVGLLYVPELAGAVVAAIALGIVMKKRQMQFLPLVGMLVLAAGIGIFRIQLPPSQTLTLLASAVTGLGLGATVAPALFAAGFSLRSPSLQRVFAIVELMRAMAAFMIAPIFAHFVTGVASTGLALWVGMGLALGGAAIAVLIYLLGGARPETPNIEAFVAGDAPAWYSPPLLDRLRKRRATSDGSTTS